ncbi:MAG TPA: M61 family peptidase [Verrucomicrobiae bacterium]
MRRLLFLWPLLCGAAFAADSTITLQVDATDSPREILRAKLHIPAQPGPLTLVYPKWIPGEHGPTGPITDLTGLAMSAAGQPIAWQRDADDMFAFHLDVPPGAGAVDVSLDFLLPPNTGEFSAGGSATAKLLDLSWNQILLYPQGSKPEQIQFAAELKLPDGWKFGAALVPEGPASGGSVRFAPVSLERLVDSPVIAGAYFRDVDLSPKGGPPHDLDIAADSAAALEITPAETRHFRHLVAETEALFGARHYGSYHFLLTLSDHVAHFGLEHHESSDDRTAEKYLTDDDTMTGEAYLLCHEMVHSWNGKYRRPAGLATPDYQQPMKGELLWVYEGLTDYLGVILTARSGLWTNDNFRQYLAIEAANLAEAPGRQWRPLADTAVAAQLLYFSRNEGASWRRSTDFYEEGDLLWLEADAIIRQQTRGQRSLDDFCRKFHGGQSGPPQVVPYTREDVARTLNEIAPYDWNDFFQKRVYDINARAPFNGIEAAGWRLTFTNGVPDMLKIYETERKYTDMRSSLGFIAKENGYIIDVLPGSPADKAGMGVSMNLVAVNKRRWTPEILRAAVKFAATNDAPVELLVENQDYFKTCPVDYHGGERYPQLERDPSKPDLLTEILKPLTPELAP